MRKILTSFACLVLLASASAQQQKKSTHAKTKSAQTSSLGAILEPKIRKSWEDYKNRNKQAFAASLAPDFSEVTDGADGIFGKDTELSEMDHFNLAQYELKDFKARSIGSTGALLTYTAEYSGSYDNTPLKMKTVYGEVWVKSGNDWKQLWVQETKLK
jgi:hypothetical protein